MKFWIGFAVPFAITAIIIITIIVIRYRRKKASGATTTHGATHTTEHHDSHHTANTKSSWGKISENIIIIIFLGILILLIVKMLFWILPSVKNFFKAEEKKVYRIEWVVDKSITIPLTSVYSSAYNLPHNKGISFENANVPYCVINGDGAVACGEKGEEISSRLPKNSRGNSSLRFKMNFKRDTVVSDATVNLVTWKQVTIEVK